ncbi:MAG: Gfo/Idh/MocA family oxidoreductase [Acidobacteria bacterium]|nr:Gfo/Idh/MocA family oxidoreductase [Acidobacteriota bacterium]
MTLPLAIAGIGNWGFNHVRTFHQLPECELKLVCDLSEKRLQKVKEISQNIPLTNDYQQIIKDDNIAGVVIATDADTHYKLAKDALLAGKAVFVEKPITLDLHQAIELVELAEQKRQVLMVGHLLLYHPIVTAIKKYIDSGEWGEIFYIYSTRVNLGTLRTTENALWSLAPHDISVMMYLTGQSPEVINAVGNSYIKSDVQDVVFFSLNFPNNIMGHGQASWLDPHKIRQFTIVSRKKMAVFDDTEPKEKLRIYDKGVIDSKEYVSYEQQYTIRDGDIFIPAIKMVEPLKLECQHFIDCIINNKKPLTDGINGLEVLKVLTAAQKSLEKGGTPIKLADL